METFLLPTASVIGGFLLLLWGADRFVDGASGTARILGISPLIIGLVVVGFGTSAPEMMVSSLAAVQGNGQMGMGNALGSNIANIALIIGATALIRPLMVHSGVLRREMPILLILSLLALPLLLDGHLSQLDGLILFGSLILVMVWMVITAMRARGSHDPLEEEFESELNQHTSSLGMALFWLMVGLVTLLVGSKALVWGAVEVAQTIGVSDLVIGLTIVAVGTSLPELATSITSALKREDDIAIGNIIGSNLFNLLGVMALPGIIAPGPFSAEVLWRDYPLMLLLTLALLLMMFLPLGKPKEIDRREGAILLAVFIGYQAYLFIFAPATQAVAS